MNELERRIARLEREVKAWATYAALRDALPDKTDLVDLIADTYSMQMLGRDAE